MDYKGRYELEEPYYSDFNINYEEVYSELERLKSENYSLKRQLRNKNSTNKEQRKLINKLTKKLKCYSETRQHYRNGRKRGSNGFNG